VYAPKGSPQEKVLFNKKKKKNPMDYR